MILVWYLTKLFQVHPCQTEAKPHPLFLSSDQLQVKAKVLQVPDLLWGRLVQCLDEYQLSTSKLFLSAILFCALKLNINFYSFVLRSFSEKFQIFSTKQFMRFLAQKFKFFTVKRDKSYFPHHKKCEKIVKVCLQSC